MGEINDKLTFEWKGRTITTKLEIKPGHFGPATYTVFANRNSEIFVFRKIDGVWVQAYGKEHGDMKDAIIKALDEGFEK